MSCQKNFIYLTLLIAVNFSNIMKTMNYQIKCSSCTGRGNENRNVEGNTYLLVRVGGY